MSVSVKENTAERIKTMAQQKRKSISQIVEEALEKVLKEMR